MTTTLYRLYGRGPVLLYVGIADRVTRRLSEHAREKPWWDEVVNITFENHAERHTAERAEREAIQTEQPRHNVIHSTLTVPRQPSITIEWRCEVCDLPVDDEAGILWLDLTDALDAERADAATSSTNTLHTYAISELPEAVRWHVHHHACDPAPDANAYDIAVERIRTVPQLLEWAAHLIEKPWLSVTDWERILRTTAAQMVGE